jgi:hypothetical protein
MTPILARTLSWFEVANSASIIFDLRVTAVAGEPEAETHGRFIAEARSGLLKHSCWNRGARALVKPEGICAAGVIDSSTVRHVGDARSEARALKARAEIEPRQCAGPFDLQNQTSDSSPLSLPPRAFPPLTWTAGDSRAVLFL